MRPRRLAKNVARRGGSFLGFDPGAFRDIEVALDASLYYSATAAGRK